MSFAQQATVTVPAASSGTITDADIYLKISDAKLKPVGSGGLVQVSGTSPTGETVPFDLIFTSDAAATTLFNWSIKAWDQTNGIVYARIRKSSYTTSTFVVYANVGDATVVGYQGGTIGQDLASNVKGDWPLGNGTTLNVKDFSSNANNGVASSVTSTTGQIDGGGTFGSTSTLLVGATCAGSGTNVPLDLLTFTYTAWVNPSSFATNEDILTGGASGMPQFRILTSGKLSLDSLNTIGLATSSGSVTLNAWNHVAITFNGATGDYVFYINGAASGSGTVSIPANWTLSTWSFRAHTWTYGKSNGNPSYTIGDCRIYNAVIPSNQIASYYSNGNSLPLFGAFASSGATATFAETIALLDTFLGKLLFIYRDTLNISDALYRAIGISKAEVLTLVDALQRKITVKYTEVITIIELVNRNIYHAFKEFVTLLDILKYTQGLHFNEAFNLIEVFSIRNILEKFIPYFRRYLADVNLVQVPNFQPQPATQVVVDTKLVVYIRQYLGRV